MKQHLINHIVFVVDDSGSMAPLKAQVVTVFDRQVKQLVADSKEFDQETRASVYTFGSKTTNLIYDMDVMRVGSIKEHYTAGQGYTALYEAAIKSIEDLKLTAQLYGDHAFLIYVLTDGENNRGAELQATLTAMLCKLPENWTVAVLVPNDQGRKASERCGFSPENIKVWSTTATGLKEAGDEIATASTNFMRARSTGTRGTKNLFALNTAGLSKSVVTNLLDVLSPKDYNLFPVHEKKSGPVEIAPFVESWTKEPYVKGSCYYQLTKSEKVQNYKQVCVQEKANGKIFGGSNARKLLGLPDHEIKVSPADHDKYTIFVQSTSLNRHLVGGTMLLQLK